MNYSFAVRILFLMKLSLHLLWIEELKLIRLELEALERLITRAMHVSMIRKSISHTPIYMREITSIILDLI